MWVMEEASTLKWNESKFHLQVATVSDLCWQEFQHSYPTLDMLLPACTAKMKVQCRSECSEGNTATTRVHCLHMKTFLKWYVE